MQWPTPCFSSKPKSHIMTLEHSWTDQKIWSNKSNLNPYWPYTSHDFVFYPDFTNQVNVAESYATTVQPAGFRKVPPGCGQ